jgi:hypothetical protein
MYDVYVTMAIIMFVLGWYAVMLAGHLALSRFEGMRVMWCPALSTFSLIEISSANGVQRVKNCLLWPEYGTCGGSCLIRRVQNV